MQNELYPSPASFELMDDAPRLLEFLGCMLGKAMFEGILLELPLARAWVWVWVWGGGVGVGLGVGIGVGVFNCACVCLCVCAHVSVVCVGRGCCVC